MRPNVLIKMGSSEVMTNSTLCLIKGQVGSGKSRLAMNMMVGFSGASDSLGFEYTPCPDGRYVIYLSTEMSKYHLQKRLISILQECPLEYENKLKIIDLYSSQNKVEEMRKVFNLYHPYVVIIDQIADFVNDINNINESVDFIKEINLLIEKYDTSFIGIIHQNEDSPIFSKARGHLGSLFEQKVTCSLAILDYKNYFKIQSTKLREGTQINLQCVFNEFTSMLTTKKEEDIVHKLVFPCGAAILDSQIMKLKSQSENTARKIRHNLEKQGKIISYKVGREITYDLPKITTPIL